MFTGIVEYTGTVTSIQWMPGGMRWRVDAGALASDCAPGCSVCVSGVCLTVAERTGTQLNFDLISETLRKTTLGTNRPGDRVNLERSLRVGDRVDGHFVQGHVDGRATVERVVTSPQEHVVWLRPEPLLNPYVIPKGSVAVDGVSLTIACIEAGAFSVALIPTTLERTTLAALRSGDTVNIETDVLVRTIVHRLEELSAATGLSALAVAEESYL